MRIPLSSVDLSGREREYAQEALESGWISSAGDYVGRFERALAQRLIRRHVIAVSNGTAALELALRAMGVGPGDEVLVPALTFAAPAATVCAVGACPVLSEIDIAQKGSMPAQFGRPCRSSLFFDPRAGANTPLRCRLRIARFGCLRGVGCRRRA